MIYDNYDLERASTLIQNIEIENISNIHGVHNDLKYDMSDAAEKHLLYKQNVAWNFNCYWIAQRKDYANNPIYQELSTESEYFTDAVKRIDIDLRDSQG